MKIGTKILSTKSIALPPMPSLIIQVIGRIHAYGSWLTSFNAVQCKCNASPWWSQLLPLPTNLSISHTRLHISRRWILRTSSVASITMATATTSLSLLRATHPCTLRHGAPCPPLVHRRHHWLGSTRLPRASAASYNATKDRKQQKTADATAYPDDEITIVVNPATDLFRSGRTFALTLLEVSN